MMINDLVQCAGKPGIWKILKNGSLPGLWWLESQHGTTSESIQVHENRLVAANTPVMATAPTTVEGRS